MSFKRIQQCLTLNIMSRSLMHSFLHTPIIQYYALAVRTPGARVCIKSKMCIFLIFTVVGKAWFYLFDYFNSLNWLRLFENNLISVLGNKQSL